jgi:transcriptional regulator with XRE-family HTH domain
LVELDFTDLSWQDECVDDVKERLGQAMRSRRLYLGLSVHQAARIAGVARNTWSGAETASRQLTERNHAGVERALYWSPGSVAAILAGRDPIELPDAITASAARRVRATESDVVDAIWNSGLPDEYKLELVDELTRGRREAERRVMQHLKDLTRMMARKTA